MEPLKSATRYRTTLPDHAIGSAVAIVKPASIIALCRMITTWLPGRDVRQRETCQHTSPLLLVSMSGVRAYFRSRASSRMSLARLSFPLRLARASHTRVNENREKVKMPCGKPTFLYVGMQAFLFITFKKQNDNHDNYTF